MAEDDIVLYDSSDGVAVITFNRPERLNAWLPETIPLYFDLLDRAVADPAVGAIVVTGAGTGFCGGADTEFLEGIRHGDVTSKDRPLTYPAGVPKLMVAAINGGCAGLGLSQALLCDVRFAAAGAKMTTAFARRGLVAEHGSAWLLPRIVGLSVAMDLLTSARVFLAEEALALGLVSRVLPPGELLDAAIAYAGDVSRNCSPASVAAIKRQVLDAAGCDLATAVAESERLMSISFEGPDFAEGLAAYVGRRPPAFPPLGRGTHFDR